MMGQFEYKSEGEWQSLKVVNMNHVIKPHRYGYLAPAIKREIQKLDTIRYEESEEDGHYTCLLRDPTQELSIDEVIDNIIKMIP